MNSTPLLACEAVTVRFGGVVALDGVNFNAKKGAVTSIIGPNGAGKTTLLNAITGMVQANEGHIGFAGNEITDLPTYKRGQAGVVRTFQNLEVFSNMSVIENVMTGCHRHVKYSVLDCLLKTPRYHREERRCTELAMNKLEFVELAELAQAPSGDLAFGQQRAMELARALASEPELLLLDEPAAGLNMKETKALGKLIGRIRSELGVTVVLVEHDMDLVMGISDEIMVLNYGKDLAVGSPQQVQKNPEVIRAYLGEDDET
ncbi:ABC transporter ATP-binding protein [Desulfovibrio ferrophilus]|uniref:ABC transporter ATP-binding protein n=1 Tax=Desulfovibrio ferrophilus TaxID=241368 RepID=A0A2Z6B3N1_9BACT|nr:ABC transporter ATP-binding protein [Desulfovibrio ferrophilus]BBD10036.1 ABC transporter ATP-binding protein [Desulfovibrio ferrophilus]